MHWLDPDFLPMIAGKIERFTINLDGDIDGFVFDHGILVHVPPHLSDQVQAIVRCGDEIRVRGVKPRGADLIAAVSIEATNGRDIVDDGPDPHRQDKSDKAKKSERSPMDPSGVVRLTLFAPKGQIRGAILDDGTILRLGHKEAARIADRLRPGSEIAARGDGLVTDHGCVIEVREIGGSDGTFDPIKKTKRCDSQEPEADEASAAT